MTPFQSKVLVLARMGHIEAAVSTKTGNPVKWMMGKRDVSSTIARLVSSGHLTVIRARLSSGNLPRLE